MSWMDTANVVWVRTYPGTDSNLQTRMTELSPKVTLSHYRIVSKLDVGGRHFIFSRATGSNYIILTANFR
jgi:hypothetical protein